MFQTDDVIPLGLAGVPADLTGFVPLGISLNVTLVVIDAAPFLLEALLDAMVLEGATSVRLADTSVWVKWLDASTNALVVIVVFYGVVDTALSNLIHCTDILFVADASMGSTA